MAPVLGAFALGLSGAFLVEHCRRSTLRSGAGRLLADASAAIFDIDGTIIDSVDQHALAWQEAFSDFGHAIDYAAIRGQIGKGGDQLMPVFLSAEEMHAKAEELEKHRATLFKQKYLPQITAFPEVRDLFERLWADGKRIVLASSAKKDELAVYKRIANITDLVSDEVSGDDVDQSKPHPDTFERALQKLGALHPEQVIAVGDAPYDAQAARKTRLRTVGLLCGGFAEGDLRKAGCAAICRDPAALLAQYLAAAGPTLWG
ncbi:MAG TPA: HAD family hydrolase [Stellaceae bacterium]|nr:HAD family hydrolase [Stellaceae bacterium]